MKALLRNPSAQSVAPKCTMVGNEQPSKRPTNDGLIGPTFNVVNASVKLLAGGLKANLAAFRSRHLVERTLYGVRSGDWVL